MVIWLGTCTVLQTTPFLLTEANLLEPELRVGFVGLARPLLGNEDACAERTILVALKVHDRVHLLKYLEG